MKLRTGDTVIVTAGKDKGKTGDILQVLPKQNKVVVAGANFYTRNIKPIAGRAGEQIRKERPLPVANVAILNGDDKPDRIGFSIAKDGSKTRIFKKTGKVVPTKKQPDTKK